MITEVMYMQEGRIDFHKTFEDLRSDTGERKLSKVIAQIMQRRS